MTQTPAPSSPLHTLATRWNVLSMMVVAFARQISIMRKTGASGAQDAALLEAFLYRAILQISRDISAHCGQTHPLTDEETRARQYLDITYAYLMALALLMRLMRAEFDHAAERYAALRGGISIWPIALPRPPLQQTPAIDSS